LDRLTLKQGEKRPLFRRTAVDGHAKKLAIAR
jgi:hypothetical protein